MENDQNELYAAFKKIVSHPVFMPTALGLSAMLLIIVAPRVINHSAKIVRACKNLSAALKGH